MLTFFALWLAFNAAFVAVLILIARAHDRHRSHDHSSDKQSNGDIPVHASELPHV